MINFFKNIFIWWNRQTIGTMLYTLFFGKFRGTDEFGNKFSQDFKQHRTKVLSKQDIQQGIINVSGDYIGKEATQIKDVVMGRGASISQGEKKTKNGNKK